MAKLTHYYESQLASRLRLPITVIRSARHAGAIPKPAEGGLWTRAQVDTMKARVDEIEAAAGLPLLSGGQACRLLERRLGLEPDTLRVFQIDRLIDRGLLHQLHDRPDNSGTLVACHLVEQAAKHPDIRRWLAEDAPLGPNQAAERLGVRRADWDHVVRAGWVYPATWAEVQFGTSKAGAVDVPLYRTVEVDAVVAAHPEVDWDAVRSTPKGRRSLLAKVPAAA